MQFCKYIVRLTPEARRGHFRQLKLKTFYRGGMPPDPPRFLRLRRSVVSKTVRIFPRSAPDISPSALVLEMIKLKKQTVLIYGCILRLCTKFFRKVQWRDSTNFEAALSLLLYFNLQSQAQGRERKSDFGNDCGISFIEDKETQQRRL